MPDNKKVVVAIDGTEVLELEVPKTYVVCQIMHLRPWARRNFRWAKKVDIFIRLTDRETILKEQKYLDNIKSMHEAGKSIKVIAHNYKVSRQFIRDILGIKDQTI